MSAWLLHSARTPTAATASTAALGYEAANALLPSVAREWRATTAGTSWLQVDLGASVTVAAIGVTGINCQSCLIQADNSAAPTTNRGTLTAALDRQGRGKGNLRFFAPASVRYIRVNFSNAFTPFDSATFWRAASVYVFATSLALPRDPLYGGTSIDWLTPQQRVDLPNGNVEAWDTGPSRAEIALAFAAREADDLEEVRRRTRAGACWFDFGVPADVGLQFPVRNFEDVVSSRYERFNRRLIDVRLREIA